MALEFQFEFDRGFVREGLRRDHLWKAGIRLATYLVLVVMVLLIYGGPAILEHPTVAMALALGLAIVTGASWWRYRSAVEQTWQFFCNRSPGRTIRYRLDDEALHVEMESGSTRYAWRDLRRLWRYRRVWLVEVVKNRSVLFPAHAATAEIREFMVARCRDAGIRA